MVYPKNPDRSWGHRHTQPKAFLAAALWTTDKSIHIFATSGYLLVVTNIILL